jgi:predicted HTH domain antitoxin
MSTRELKQELAFALYGQGKISFGKARELAEMSAWKFQGELGTRRILPHYDAEDFLQDVDTLRSLNRL